MPTTTESPSRSCKPITRCGEWLAPAGKGTIEFRYEPAGFAWGLRFAAMALLALTGWAGGIVWSRTRPPVVRQDQEGLTRIIHGSGGNGRTMRHTDPKRKRGQSLLQPSLALRVGMGHE